MRCTRANPQHNRRGLAVLVAAGLLPFPAPRRCADRAVLTIHPISRFLIEIIRIDESAVLHTQMSIAQNISLALLAVAALLWAYILWAPARLALPPKVVAA